jgi:acyl-homoserine-lactone acylase
MRTTRPGRLVTAAVALLTASAALPAGAAELHGRREHPSHGGTSAVIRYTEYGIPHIVARDYRSLGFGTGWAQAADQVCTLADGFVTLRGERSRFFGPERGERPLAVLGDQQPLQ